MTKYALRAMAVLFAATVVPLLFGDQPPVAVVPAAVAVFLWWRSGAGDRAKQRTDQVVRRLIDETETFFSAVNSSRAFPESGAERAVSATDDPILVACNAKLLELKTSKSQVHAGTRIKLGGLPIYLGRSVPVAETKLAESSSGELVLTAKKLMFVGERKSVDFALQRVMSVDIVQDAFTVTLSGRQRPVTFQVPNGLLWGELVKNVLAMPIKDRRLPDGRDLSAL